jgi:flagellar hook protein FlgE
MGIFDALNTAVSGLQAQSFALQNISGNIANSQTTGYKETDTYFEDLVSAAALGYQTANGVTAGSKSTNTVQGTIQGASVSTDMAINGDGWFVVPERRTISRCSAASTTTRGPATSSSIRADISSMAVVTI